MELLSPLKEALDDVAHVSHDLNAVFVALVVRLLLENNQLPTALEGRHMEK